MKIDFLSSPVRKSLVLGLLVILVLELGYFIRRETQTWDEACHIFAGYSYWTRGDFGINPEHPPLVKLLTTAPLLNLPLHAPPHGKVFAKEEDFTAATTFVYSNNAEQIMFRTRTMAALLTLLLAILIFVAAREMFGHIAALVALALFVFEPTLLAHGAVITTDMGMSLFLLATVYAFYRYVKRPSVVRLVSVGLASGLAMATKHSAVLIPPILILLGIAEVTERRRNSNAEEQPVKRGQTALRLVAAIIVIGLIAGIVLWSSYGFHFHPRQGVETTERLTAYAARLKHPFQAKMIVTFAHAHLLPESYLYGLTDVGFTAEFSHAYLLGKIYPHGVWFYFPVAFVIKTTLGLLILLALGPLALKWATKRPWRELAFITVPAFVYLAVAMASLMNIGVRHILPAYPFLIILAGWAAAVLIERRRIWAYVVALLVVWNAVSSLRTAPVYLSYSNELWGSSGNTYRYLSDSNVDWGQQLKSVKNYLDGRGSTNCWFAYFADVVVDPKYYGVNCRPLTSIASVWLRPTIDVPASIDGPVFISAGVLSGYEFGPGELNPYDQFQKLPPSAVIENGVFVFDGHFDIPLASALNHVTRSRMAAEKGHLEEALAEVQTAAQLAPDSVMAQSQLGFLLLQMKRADQGTVALQKALSLAETIHPEFQVGTAKFLRETLKNNSSTM